MDKIPVEFYTKSHCPLCDEARAILAELEKEFPMDIKELDIYAEDSLLETYQLKIPVIEVHGQALGYGQFSINVLRNQLQRMQKEK